MSHELMTPDDVRDLLKVTVARTESLLGVGPVEIPVVDQLRVATQGGKRLSRVSARAVLQNLRHRQGAQSRPRGLHALIDRWFRGR